MDNIKPELVGGVRDYLPQTMIARQKILDKIRKVYESFGFVPLETPAIEKFEVLTGRDDKFKMNLFRTIVANGTESIESAAKRQNKEAKMALRFDLTIPLSRVITAYPNDIPKIFKRYQTGKVWRGEKAQAGRFREFTQFDADIVGTNSMLADTEIIQIIYTVMKALNINDFLIRINNRKILNGLLDKIGAKNNEQYKEIMRILDKQEKISRKELVKELSRKPENKYDIAAPNLAQKEIDILIDFADIEGKPKKVLSKAKKLIGQNNKGLQGVKELSEIISNLQTLDIPQKNWTIDLSIARGLDYYTGPVFETNLTKLKNIGSVYSGGRFDGLSNRFIPNSNIPAVGASVGVDRLFNALEILKQIKTKPCLTKVMIALFDKGLVNYYLQLAEQVRSAGVETEIYLENEPLKTQIIYAAKQEIPLVVIVGSNEKEQGQISIKNMKTRKQVTINKNNFIDTIKAQLKAL